MTIERQVAETHECARALAYRLQQASRNDWDQDRCIAEGEQFMRSLRARGWRHVPEVMAAPTWRDHKTPADPTPYAEQAREAIRANREQTHYVGDDCRPPHEETREAIRAARTTAMRCPNCGAIVDDDVCPACDVQPERSPL